ncbi:MAG: hypothetical protein COA42_04360 [Alteromonadaceae bacterium]|nr:MAG: hypothetical protein COA42_04360 [Alteromonadaceae bacterium]
MITAKLGREIIVFGIIGVLATALHYSIALLSVELVALSVYLGNLFGYLCAVCVSYFGHGIFTFRTKLSFSIAGKFVVGSIVVFLFGETMLLLMQKIFATPHRISLALVVTSSPIISFIFNKFWVYTK